MSSSIKNQNAAHNIIDIAPLTISCIQRFIVQSGAGFCTQSSSKSHFEEDLNVFDFKLSDDEMVKIYQS